MHTNTLKLIFPQWQGGDIAHFFPDLKQENAACGYILGSEILNILTKNLNPNLDENVATVPVSLDYKVDEKGKRIKQKGIIDKEILKTQHKSAMAILEAKKPDKILILGGDCAVSIAPFTYLAKLYKDDLAMLWIDAHPDLGFINDDFYQGYHAMAVSAIVGDEHLKKEFALPSQINANKTLLVGLCSNEAKHYDKRMQDLGIRAIFGEEIVQNENATINKMLTWLQNCKAKKLVIHLDLDVLNPNELYAAVGNTGILSIANVLNIINALDGEIKIIALTIAEHFPKIELKLKELLENLPFIKKRLKGSDKKE